MSSRRLVQRRPGATGSSVRSASSGTPDGRATVSLPPYEPPSCAATAEARRAIADLSDHRDTRYEDHIKKAIRALGESTAAINDSLGHRQARLRGLDRRRRASGLEGEDELKRLEEYTASLEGEITELTQQAEKSVRGLIDHKAALEDEQAVLSRVHTTLATQPPPPPPSRRGLHPASQGAGGDDDSEMRDVEDVLPSKGPLEMMKEAKERKAAEYQALDAHRRYGLNNDYAAFKRLWHDAVHGDEVPLPDAKRWFDAQGRPVMTATSRGRDGSGESDGEDEDLVIAGETLSFKCPLSLREFTEPYTSRVCKHSFEKSAIFEFIGRKLEIQCPQSGCDKVCDHNEKNTCDPDAYRPHAEI